MNIFDVVIDTEDLLVLGPVDNVDVQVDIGPTGQRGARFFVGSGDPNTPGVIPLTEDVQIGDYFINSSNSGDYGWLYVRQVGQNNVTSWVKALKIQPALYANNFTVDFSSGLGSFSIPISEITSDTSITNITRYVAQLTPISADPLLLTLQQKRIPAPDFNRLFLDVRALRFISNAWVPLTGSIVIGATVSVV